MSDVQEVISLSRSVFDEAEEFSDSGSSNEGVSSTRGHDNKNEEQVATQERRWIGTMVTKIFDGHRVMGEVIAYDEEISKFKIVYEDDKQEEVCENELLSLAAPPEMVREYLDRVELSRNNEKKKKRTSKATKTSTLKIRIPIKSNQPKAKEEVKGKRTRKAAQNPSTYIPLAIRENKRDAYIWYY